METFVKCGMSGRILITGILILALRFANTAALGTENTSTVIENWLTEIEVLVSGSASSTTTLSPDLSDMIATAVQNDERNNVLQAHIDVIKARAKAGRSWPDPELRIGYDNEDDGDQINRRAALRFRLPDRADKRLLEKMAQVDTDWTNNRIKRIRRTIALKVKSVFANGLFARMRLLSGTDRIRGLFQQDQQLQILRDAGKATAMDEAQLVVEELRLYRTLRSEYAAFENAITELINLGISPQAARAALQTNDWHQLLATQLSSLQDLEKLAIRNSEETHRYLREAGMLTVRLSGIKRSWLPSPSFFQIEWGDQKEFGESGRDNEWGAMAGFTVELFDDHEEEVLLSLRRETDLDYHLYIQSLAQTVARNFKDLQTNRQSYQQLLSISEPATLAIQELLDQSKNEGASLTSQWGILEDLYDLESELLEMRWGLVESLLEFESTVGQLLTE